MNSRSQFRKLRIRFAVGVVFGFLYSLVYIDLNQILRLRDMGKYVMHDLLELMLFLILGQVVTMVVRLFTPSMKLIKYTLILEVFLGIAVWLPVTSLIMSYVSKLLLMVPQGHMEFTEYLYAQIAMHILLFSLTYMIIGIIMGRIYTDQLKLATKRFKLEQCRVFEETRYEVEHLITKGQKFQDCYNIIKHMENPGIDRFYRITEMTFFGKNVVDRWYYYTNGNVTKMTDIGTCKAVYRHMMEEKVRLEEEAAVARERALHRPEKTPDSPKLELKE